MAYFSPFVDETGLHIPSYTDLKEQLISEAKQIYGDIYLDEDSADYQFISIFAKKIFDSYSLAALVYNNRSPVNAVGVGLDGVVSFANIQRKPATFSSVQLTITGSPGTKLVNAQASDISGNLWDIPETTIPDNGTMTVECTCNVSGNIGALPNTINTIATPTYGWASVTNNQAAIPGTDIETDAELRGRYSLAIRSPSSTVFESILAGVESIDDVTRVVGYENDTGSESTGTEPPNVPAGLPAHSITIVVEGGEDQQVANEIYIKKTPGCYTNGTTSVQIISESGNIDTIRFYRPTYTNVFVSITAKKLQSWNDELETKMKQSIVDYINGLGISDDVYVSMIWSVAISVMPNINSPAFSVTSVELGTQSGSYSASDIEIQFNSAAQCNINNVQVVFQ